LAAQSITPLNRDHLMEQAHARGTGRSQATVVEQSRAIAEVQGALLVADRRPRDTQYALSQALESCRTQDVAQGAFFKFPRGGQTVAGASIHLARELARCWGNIVYAIVELDRDDDRHVSEMMAYAWDLETNARCQLQFLVPHKRDKRGGAEILTDMRDIYENNANMGARRLRECIFAVLPPYLTKAAERECHLTLQGNKDEKPLPVRVNEALAAFEGIGIGRDRIEGRMGPISKFTAVDLANLRVSYGSIQRGEISSDDEFPRVDRLTAEMMESTTKRDKESGPEQSAAEYLGDEIPRFEGNENAGGAVAPDPASEVEGATEQRPDDADPGEPADDLSPAEQFLRTLRESIEAAEDKAALKAVDANWAKNRAAYDDDTAAGIDALITAKRKALAGEAAE